MVCVFYPHSNLIWLCYLTSQCSAHNVPGNVMNMLSLSFSSLLHVIRSDCRAYASTYRHEQICELVSMCVTGSQSPAVPTSLAAAPNRACRLQDWVNRELQALLHQENVSVVRSFVISLATAHCLDRHQGQQQQAAGSARQEEEAINALQPFLHDRAAHFWHELK